MRIARGSVLALLAVALLTPAARAQVLPRPTPVQQQPQPGDTTRKPQSLPQTQLQWIPLDSIALELLKRPGTSAVRYQADTIDYDAKNGIMTLIGKKGARAIVDRNGTSLVADTITFLEKSDSVLARGDSIRLREPGQTDDLLVSGSVNYDLRARAGTATNVSTSTTSGETWRVSAHRAGFVAADSATGRPDAFYGARGIITSCTDSVRHYHFAAAQIKRISNDIIVARDVVLHVMGVPVLWLPFIFQDAREGRRSGILTPRFGLTELARNSDNYRRNVENLGYYFALTDYFDALVALDWRSSANATEIDPGWTRWNTEFRYRWLDRFASGRIGASFHSLSNGTSNTQLSWSHSQDFSTKSHLTTNLNFATSTTVQRQTALAPIAALATIASQANFQRDLGPLQMSVGGSRRQYPGRKQVDMDFPTLNVTSRPLTAGEWLTWTPGLNIATTRSEHIDAQGDFANRLIVRPDGGIDSTKVDRGTHSLSLTLNTPVKIYDFQIQAAIRASDRGNDYPELRTIIDPVDTSKKSVRVFEKTWLSTVDFDLGVNLPQFFGGTWNLVPSITMSNVASGAFMVRTERTGKKWVAQSKRFNYGVGVSPTFFGLLPGIGSIERIRHSVQTSLSYSYSPEAKVGADYLEALGQTQTGFLGNFAQNRLTLGIQQVFEAKMKSAGDSVAPENARKLKLLSLGFSPLTWDFERAKHSGSGFATERFDMSMRSDLLPGFDAGVTYSLFSGNIQSDSAKFSPYLESIRAGFNLGAGSGIGGLFGRLFGGPNTGAQADTTIRQAPSQAPVRGPEGGSIMGTAGRSIRGAAMDNAAQIRGFEAQISFSLSQQRPPTGTGVVDYDPAFVCEPYRNLNPIQYDACVRNALATPPADVNATQTTAGGTFFRVPPQMNMQARTGFNLTPKWAATWSTNYDFQRSEFGLQAVTLSREMHDWRAVFGFTQAPNGAFTFTFFVALKSEPDIKFDYNRATYGSQIGTTPP